MRLLLLSLLIAVLASQFFAPLLAQNASPAPAKQIGPGSTGTISPAQGVTPSAGNQPQKILKSALSPQTRQTLQDAMNSLAAPSR